MATYKIQAPNGQTYQIDGPEGASQEEIQQEVLRQNPEAAGTTPKPAQPTNEKINHGWGGLGSAGMGAAQGLSFGFSDEIEAGARTLASKIGHWVDESNKEQDYDALVKEARQRYADAKDDNPNAFMAGDVGGSVAGAALTGGLGGGAAGAGLAGRVGAGLLSGAAAGAARGVGDGEGLSDSLTRAGTGAMIGGGVGGVLPGAGALVRGAGDLTMGATNAIGNMGAKAVDMFADTPFIKQNLGKSLQRGLMGPAADTAVDHGTDWLAAKGMNGLAQKIADGYANSGGGAGITARAIGSHFVPGLVPAEAAVRGGAFAAQQAGTAMQSPLVNKAAASMAASDNPGLQYKGPWDDKGVRAEVTAGQGEGLTVDDQILARAMETQFAPQLQDAMKRGDTSVKNALYILKRNPEFRKAVGLDLNDLNN